MKKVLLCWIGTTDLRASQGEDVGEGQPGFQRKEISAGAKNILLNHDWPGNIRELRNTLTRAMVWTDGKIIEKQDIEEAFLPPYDKGGKDVLNRPLDGDFSLPELISEVAKHYIQRAEGEFKTKTEAARTIGILQSSDV